MFGTHHISRGALDDGNVDASFVEVCCDTEGERISNRRGLAKTRTHS